MKQCTNCRFFYYSGGRWGECRRYPPPSPGCDVDGISREAKWPLSDERNWCGEWRLKGDPDEQNQ